MVRTTLMCVLVLICASPVAAEGARKPPMGWNSWDCFQGNLNESIALEIAAAIKTHLLPSGYDSLTIDEFWYLGDCQAHSGCLDQHGRPQPDVAKWPSSAHGKGFKPVIDKIHAMGLKVGIHTLRGSVSAAAIAAKSPILGTKYTVDQIATTGCSWNAGWFAVNMTHPAAQPWLDSVYGQYAEWGVDLIKNDCIFAQNMKADNIKAISAAITKSGREMTYSLSPGGQNEITQLVADAVEIAASVNIYRITDDWHGGNMEHHFAVAAAMSQAGLIGGPTFNSRGSFPDLDMLNPYQNASSDPNFKAQMTLWVITRSPLIYGADIRSATSADDFALLTNTEVLAVSAESSDNRPANITDPNRAGQTVTWMAKGANGETYVAFIKRAQIATTATVSFAELGMPASTKSCTVRDLWAGKAVTPVAGMAASWAQPGGSGYDGAIFSLTECS